ncbi:NAD(P)/FAD-dependent oxidoreductase [Candidatus Gracilibacteria bacterium]|nr:NAD(P)/FAD-dependent oxidoreductase [Candidatus Gracilibacteria bacterium]
MQILILGAGYAGLRAALDLDRLLAGNTSAAQVTLVDQNSYHQLVQLLHLTATKASYAAETARPLDRIVQNRSIRCIQGRVVRLDPAARCVHLADGAQLPYDRVVLALGGETSYADIPGAREHTLPLRSYKQAIALREHLISSFLQAATTSDDTARRILMTTAIVGGGYTGCQFAGELAAWADELCTETGAPRTDVRIALLDRSDSLLKQFGPWATREAERVLDAVGVSVYLQTSVEWVEPHILHVNDKRLLRAHTIVWAGGVVAPALIAESGLPVDSAGRAIVDRYLRVQGQAAVFAVGDCAHVPDGDTGATVPATASYATRQGEQLAQTLFDEIEGRAPRPYEALKLGELVSLGPNDGVGNPLGIPLYGLPVILLKKGVEQWYLSTIE